MIVSTEINWDMFLETIDDKSTLVQIKEWCYKKMIIAQTNIDWDYWCIVLSEANELAHWQLADVMVP